jgi:hypothetical protein
MILEMLRQHPNIAILSPRPPFPNHPRSFDNISRERHGLAGCCGDGLRVPIPYARQAEGEADCACSKLGNAFWVMPRLLRFAAKRQEPVDWPLELGSITLRRVSSELQSPATPKAVHIGVIEVLVFVALDRQV